MAKRGNRGRPSFVEQARRAEKAGALALVLVNSDNELVRPGGEDLGGDVTIPVLLVTADAAADLLPLVCLTYLHTYIHMYADIFLGALSSASHQRCEGTQISKLSKSKKP